ncbi:hypothetical protein CSA80_03175 [Candidatus Saccharibacteria bacterium]|nr:MAG: hypothetical protein CR973_00330 [Candidatus Saccharibacteria bacterium]PID99091.1 MAG: hypothetical protein CSA80_03175 [Candidatus Saccharibacteria bacterium]
MSKFKEFRALIDCVVIPMTDDGRVYMMERTVSEEEGCVLIRGRHYNPSEFYYDFVRLQADNVAKLSDAILRELYARGFSTTKYYVREEGVALDYSFISDSEWQAKRTITAIARGNITAEDDNRRVSEKAGTWFSYDELVEQLGAEQANDIFQKANT